MSVCLELSSALSNSANSSTESIESTELTTKEEERDVSPTVPSQNVAKLVLTNSINASSANTVLQKVSTSSVITLVNAPGPLTIIKSCGTSPSQFSLVNSAPLSVCNAICKPITVVGAPPITVVRAVSNLNQISKENGNNPADLVMSNSQSLNGISSDRLPIHNVFVKNTALSSELITGLSEVQKLVPGGGGGASFVQSNIIQNVTSGGTKIANGQKSTCAAGVVSNNKLKILNNIVVTSASSMSSTNTVTNNSNIAVNKSVAPKQYVQQKSLNNSLNGTSKFNKNCSTINNNFSRGGGTRTVCGMPNQIQRLYPTHKSQIRTLPPVSGNSGAKTGIKTLSPQFRGAPATNQQVSKNASKLRSVHSQQRISKMSNKPNYIGKHAIQAQKFKGSHLPGGRLKNNGKPSVITSGGGSQRTPPNAGSVYHQVLTANIIQTLGENGGNSNQEFDEMSNYSQAGYNESARSLSYSDLTGPLSMSNKPNYALDALSEVCKAILLDHNYNAAPPSESPVRNTLLTTIQTQLNGTTPASYYSPTNSNRSRVTLGTLINTPSTLSSISNSSILQSNTGSSFLQDDDAASDISCGSERKMETEGEETDTAPEAEAVTQEGYNYNDHYGDYVTRCICGFLHDDGYMIECDKCKVWQHVRCVIKLNKKVPQDYLCDECDSSKTVDRIKARALQQQWMRENQERDAKIIRKETRMQDLKSKEALSDSDSSDGEQIGLKIGNKNRVTTIGRRKPDQLQKHSFRHRRDSSRLDVHKRPIKRKDRKITKKKTKVASKTPSDDDNNHQDGWQNTSVSQIPQLRQWIENYEEAVTNHYSPELRARILSIRSNGVHSELLSQVDNSVHSCRVHIQPLTALKYLVSTETLESNVPVIELRGKYMLSTQHRGGNCHGNILSTRQHSQRPGPFLFFYRLHKDNTEVCVDTRTYGNDARFVRRSCTPNSELKHCIEKGVLHLYIVTISAVDKNMELTIKHESHDLAAMGSTNIACACDRHEECALNKSSIKKNGDTTDGYGLALRKRRGRRTVSSSICDNNHDTAIIVAPKIKEEPPDLELTIKEEVDIKVDIDIQLDQIKVEEDIKEIIKEESAAVNPLENLVIKEEEDLMRTDMCSPTPSLFTSNCVKKTPSKSDSEDKKESPCKELNTSAADKKKMSREERKIEAYMKAFERMERQQLKRQEHQAKQAHRRESEPGPNGKDEDKLELKGKRRKRKGRARTVSTNSQVRRNRLNSADSSYATSGEECLLSPIATESILSRTSTRDINSEMSTKNADLLLTLSTNSNQTEVESPVHDVDCNSNSANSSPETHLSSACLLVAAAVEPLERNFKFPKTKKILMNEWLNQSADCVQSASSISPSSLNPHFISPPENNFYEATTNANGNFYSTSKIVQVNNSYCEAPSQAHGNAKKRWLRQAISEDRCDSPNTNRPDSPPITEMVAPPKKRRLPRETLTNDDLPTSNVIVNSEETPQVVANEESSKPFNEQEDRVEIVTAGADGDSPSSVLIDDAMLKERVAEMQQEIGACFRLPETREILSKESSLRCNLDPRLTRTMFNNSDHLVATVEKNLCILGFEDQKQDVTAPTKRKLSITEYRQRKKQTSDKETVDDSVNEENGTSRSPVPQKLRLRSDSVSSTASFVSSDEEEVGIIELPAKTLSAFNSEPTELEKQRENVSLRLKKAFGLSVDDENRKTVSTIGALMSCELGTSRDNLSTLNCDRSSLDSELLEQKSEGDLDDCKSIERVAETKDDDEIDVAPLEAVKPEMFYTPDEEDMDKEEELDKIKNTAEFDVECTNYVPPFNNPVYPNSSFTSFGSVIDDDAPYEGRNPSPPPELSNVTSSYSSP